MQMIVAVTAQGYDIFLNVQRVCETIGKSHGNQMMRLGIRLVRGFADEGFVGWVNFTPATRLAQCIDCGMTIARINFATDICDRFGFRTRRSEVSEIFIRRFNVGSLIIFIGILLIFINVDIFSVYKNW